MIDKALLQGLPVIVVNDGSTDCTQDILNNYIQKIIVITYPENKGKGFALKQGFKKAYELGFSYAITLDSDGQHDPANIPLFIKKLNETGECLILGNRNMTVDNVPAKSSFGRKFSNFWFWVETWIMCSDTQTGYRLYPIEPLIKKKLYTNKFEFEIEAIVRLAWDNIPVKEVKIPVIYFPEEERVSHFRPAKDFFRISILNSILVILAYLWFIPRRFFLHLKQKTWKEIILNPSESNFRKAASLGFGVFIGIVPIWGFQMIVALAFSLILKLNKILVLIASNISIPPMIPFIIYGSLWCGKVALQTEHIVNFSTTLTFKSVGSMMWQYVLGSLILATVAGLLTFIISYLFLNIVRKEKVTQK